MAVLNPDLIILDEPNIGLDLIIAHQVSELISDLNQRAGVTILVVTPDLHSAFHIATRLALLNQGRIIETGSPSDIKQSPSPVIAESLNTSEVFLPAQQPEAGA